MRSHTHNDRKHQGYRTGVADKAADKGRHEHHKKEEPCLACTGKLNHLTTNHFRKASLKDATTYYEESDHHYDRRIREAGKGFCRIQDLTKQQGEKRTQGYHIRSESAAHEKCG